MFWTTIALVMTVLMGGIIAYNGDLIGRKFGKRRVSMFGLRPKYTAILITSVTGVMISALTTGVLFLLVKPVRDVILRGEAAIALQPRLEAGIQRLTGDIDKKQVRITELGKDVAAKEREKQDADKKAQQAERKQNQAESRLSQIGPLLQKEQAALVQVRREKAATEGEVRRLEGEQKRLLAANFALQKKNGELVVLNETLSTKNVQLIDQNKKLSTMNAALARENNLVQRENLEIANQNQNLVRNNDKLAKANEVLTRNNKLLRDTEDESREKNRVLALENSRLESQNASMKSALAKIGPHYSSISEANWVVRNKRVAVHKDEDLARVVIPANSSPEKVRSAIDSLLHDASEYARTKGAGTGDRLLAVQVVDREFLTRGPDGGETVIPVSATDRVDAVVSRLCWQSVPTCVLAIAVANSAETEPAAVDLQPFPNKLVYKKGQIITRKWINGTQSPDGVFNDLVRFLKELGQQALEQGMIPRMDPISGEPQVGALGGADLVKLVQKVKEIGGRVQIRAVAKGEVYSADPLDLDYRVEQ
jgi:uncharacterized protein (DUF3084 family)